MKKIRIALLPSLLTVMLFCSLSYGESQQITNGLTYLTTTQSPDGSWGNEATGTEILPSTIAAIEALKALNQTNTQTYSNALVWLQSQGLETTDYLAGRIHALSVDGADTDLLITYLDEVYTGAWGGDDSPDVDNLDTLLALQALKKINYHDQNIISTALYNLTSNQNIDSGWGFRLGDDSEVYYTALALQTLSQFKTTYDLQAPITNSAAYLLAKQNPDGGLGSPISTVYETALAVIALIESGAGDQQSAVSIQYGLDYLSATQQTNGSWNDDPYSTALALRALASVKPNLAITSSDITFSNQTATRGETVTITANLRNTGPALADAVLARFYDGDPNAGGIQIGTDQTIPAIDPYGTATASVSFNTSSVIGRHDIFVVVDPMNVINEAAETDNIASNVVTINTLPDLYVNSAEITHTPVNPTPDVPLNITFIVRNLGEQSLQNVLTKLYSSPPDAGGVAIDSYTIRSCYRDCRRNNLRGGGLHQGNSLNY